MGIGPKISSSSFETKPSKIEKILSIFTKKEQNKSNPNPLSYVIRKMEIVNEFLIVEIHYPNCTNYEGLKILVFDKWVKIIDLYKQSEGVDPHFSSNTKLISPIARFEPTSRGWLMAKSFCLNYN